MKARELRELAVGELKQKVEDLQKEAFDLRMVKVTGKLDNPLRLRHIRREIARITTILNGQKS